MFAQHLHTYVCWSGERAPARARLTKLPIFDSHQCHSKKGERGKRRTYSTMETSPTVIFDIGSRSIKSGLHTCATPWCTPSIVGTPKFSSWLPTLPPPHSGHESVPVASATASSHAASIVIGDHVHLQRGLLRLRYPIQSGTITNWTDLRHLLRQSLTKALHNGDDGSGLPHRSGSGTAAAVGHSSVGTSGGLIYSLVEPPFASRKQRAALAELLFETGATRAGGTAGDAMDTSFRATGIFCGVAPLLALYATGSTTGVVVDVGDGIVSTAASYHGCVLPSSMAREGGGALGTYGNGATGATVTSYLAQLLQQSGAALVESSDITSANRSLTAPFPLGSGTAAEREMLYEVKEQCCEVGPSQLSVPSSPYNLPAEKADDGDIEAVMRRRAMERDRLGCALIDAARQQQSVPQQVHRLPDGREIQIGFEARQAPEVLFYPSLLGLEARGVVELAVAAVAAAPAEVRQDLLQNVVLTGGTTCMKGFPRRFFSELQQCAGTQERVRVTAPEQRSTAAWLGASYLAQLSVFGQEMVVSRAAYEEEGEAALAKKSLY